MPYVHRIDVEDDASSRYFYIMVRPELNDKFRDVMRRQEGEINLRDYGEVIASGEGEPSEDELAHIMHKYKIKNHEDG